MCVLFHRIAQLPLSFVPTHPDRAGGIGFIERSLTMFSPVVFGLSAVAASSFAHEILFHGGTVTALRLPMTAVAVVLSIVFLLPMLCLTMGLSWLLASLGVYLRDVSQVILLVTTALLFLSPIFYPISALPEDIQRFILLNPMTSIVEDVRGVLVQRTVPELGGFLLRLAGSAFAAWLGFAWFQKTREGFADVL
jgi:ABC-type polysaccharide/polyol phosphate export permease